jgi:hypothetical protein
MIQYCLLKNIVLLVIMDKFNPNPILVNINKLKPYIFLDLTLKGLEVRIQGERDGTPNENISRMPLQD